MFSEINYFKQNGLIGKSFALDTNQRKTIEIKPNAETKLCPQTKH